MFSSYTTYTTIPQPQPSSTDEIIDILIDYIRGRKDNIDIFEVTGEFNFGPLLANLNETEERKKLRDFLSQRLNKWHFFSKHVAKDNVFSYFKRGLICSSTNTMIAITFAIFPPAPAIMFVVGMTIGFTVKQGKHQYKVRKRAHEILNILNDKYPEDVDERVIEPTKTKHHFWQKKKSIEKNFNDTRLSYR